MSTTDYRKMVDLHGGGFIAVECANGVDILFRVNDDEMRLTVEHVPAMVTRVRRLMQSMLADGFKKFEFGIKNGNTVQLDYGDAGAVLDALLGAVRFLA